MRAFLFSWQRYSEGIVLPRNIYETLLAPEFKTIRPVVAALLRRTLILRADVFRALEKYEQKHPDE